AAWTACTGAAFGYRLSERLVERDIAALGADRPIAAFDGGEIVGTAASFPAQLTLPGRTFASGGAVYAVAATPTHRRRGILTAMMHRQLRDLHERGDSLAVLTASEGAIYGRFGY